MKALASEQLRALGRGECEFLKPANRAVLAHVRKYGTQAVLAVHNLSAATQLVSIVAPGLGGLVAVDAFSGKAIAPVLGGGYEMKLAPYQYLWLRLEEPS